MFTDIQEFQKGALPLLMVFERFVKEKGIAEAKADHICFKCESIEEFEAMRKLFDFESDYVYQAIISERRIEYVKLKVPFETSLGPIAFLELSDQKTDGSQKSGFDHVEIYPTVSSHDDFAKELESKGIAIKKIVRPHHTTYDMSIGEGYLLRLEPEALVDKIRQEEMK